MVKVYSELKGYWKVWVLTYARADLVRCKDLPGVKSLGC